MFICVLNPDEMEPFGIEMNIYELIKNQSSRIIFRLNFPCELIFHSKGNLFILINQMKCVILNFGFYMLKTLRNL